VRDPAEPQAARPAFRWADLRLRTASAVVLGPVALACLWFDGWTWAVLVGLGAFGVTAEWTVLCGQRLLAVRGLGVPAVVLVACSVAASGHATTALAVLAAGFAVVALGVRHLALAAGVLYAGLCAVALLWLRSDATVGRSNVLFLVMVIWASDIGAYMVGRLLGGPRLAPAISPGKTWAGAVGGLASAVAVGVLAGDWLMPTASWRMLAAAAGFGIVAQLGDLLESGIKRRFGVKDSSRLIPGHGGLLDRLDGVMAAAPVAAVLALALGRGVVLWR
jgi:phosphatidate cytidylyltransferase